VPDSQLPEGVSLVDLWAELVALRRVVVEQADRIAELERQLGKDSSTSSRPPSSDAPWDKKPAKKHSSRTRSGRKPGKQKGSPSSSRTLAEDPDETFEVAPDRCTRCDTSLHGAAKTTRVRRQVVDVLPPPPPKVTEYQLVSKQCGGCGHVNEPTATAAPRPVAPGRDRWVSGESAPEDAPAKPAATGNATRTTTAPAAESATTAPTDPAVALVLRPGSPVRIGPGASALAALLTCGHYLPIARATTLLAQSAGIAVSTGFTAGVRRRGALALETAFLPHIRALLRTARRQGCPGWWLAWSSAAWSSAGPTLGTAVPLRSC
jgi:transposase